MLQFFEVPPGGSVVSPFFSPLFSLFFLLFVFAALVGSHFFRIFSHVCRIFIVIFLFFFFICFFGICFAFFL